MTHDQDPSAPEVKPANNPENYASLTDYYEAKLLHQAGRLDAEFYVLLDMAKETSSSQPPFYITALRAQKHFHDSLKTLRDLEAVRDAKRSKRTIEGPGKGNE